ncbi:hypothetical protein CDAR_318621 [Caerostris darwini]|uniref:Uncharacterized protein n=1 Tax=Caerostris darwini TaxID=1538125 RepID=A0AAV4Q894_9ARAC|nr:hypothetical protein CDAR_318621 [Caerostris darwini]
MPDIPSRSSCSWMIPAPVDEKMVRVGRVGHPIGARAPVLPPTLHPKRGPRRTRLDTPLNIFRSVTFKMASWRTLPGWTGKEFGREFRTSLRKEGIPVVKSDVKGTGDGHFSHQWAREMDTPGSGEGFGRESR